MNGRFKISTQHKPPHLNLIHYQYLLLFKQHNLKTPCLSSVDTSAQMLRCLVSVCVRVCVFGLVFILLDAASKYKYFNISNRRCKPFMQLIALFSYPTHGVANTTLIKSHLLF